MTRWYSEKKKEHYYKQAKKSGYRARSAYKLKQIQKKFDVLKEGDSVVDLGAAPGGWSQVARELIGENSKIVGIDLLPINPLKGVKFIKGDITEESSLEKIKEIVGSNKVDVVISDMSPNISGNYSVDQARSIFLCQQALKATEVLLKDGGHFVCKVFEGEDLKEFADTVREKFKIVKHFSPPASRNSSSEIYIVAKYKKKNLVF